MRVTVGEPDGRMLRPTRDDAPAAATAPTSRSSARRAKKAASVPRMILRGASWALFVLVSLLAIVVIVVPAVTGARAFTVLTGSMSPLYPPGTMVVVRSTPIAEINIGDVITYQLESDKPAVVTHRVVAVGQSADGHPLLITKGDANDADDPKPVLPVQVVGTLWYSVPYLGWVNNVVSGQMRGWIVPSCAAMLVCYGVATLFQSVRAQRRSRAAAARGRRRRRDG